MSGVARLGHPLCRRRRVDLAGLMRVWALQWERMVHPLCKEATVQVHLAAVDLSHTRQALQQCFRQLPRSGHGRRGQIRYELPNAFGCRRWRSDLPLQMSEQILALVAAAYRVQAGGLEAVGESAEVVGQDHARLAGIRLIQCAQLLEIRSLFGELPVGVQRLVVELMEPDAPDLAAQVGHAHQDRLQVLALNIVESGKLLTHLSNNPGSQGEVHTLAVVDLAVMAVLYASNKRARLRPATVALGEAREPQLCFLPVGDADVAVGEVDHHVRVQRLLCLLPADVTLHREPQDAVDLSELQSCLLSNEVLKGCSKSSKVPEIDASAAAALLKAPLDVRGNPVLQRCWGSQSAESVAIWLKASHVPPVLLHEEAVQHVTHCLVSQAAVLTLWK
mmetsp:Transcript_55196/g.128462  ORF Transcript_55196/g.128462 Transcript_55196/m.128462 type:complete len:391 (+) Transcript_55196:437-1609(+)